MKMIKSVMFLAMMMALAGCTRSVSSGPGEASNLKKWVEQENNKQTEPLEPLPTLTKFEAVPYSVASDRDPFNPKMMIDTSSTTDLRPDSSRPKQSLEGFALDSLKMVGTMGDKGRLSALVLAPDKITYRVSVGDYMGQSDGQVSAVFEDHINLTEVVSDGAGGWMRREAAVSMEQP